MAAEPLPVATAPYGIADWTDYQNNWRDADATWLQDRVILRASSDAMRDGFNQLPGGVVYNSPLDVLQVRSSAGGYKNLTPVPAGLSMTDQAAPTNTTTLQRSEPGAVGKGIVISVNDVGVTVPFKVLTDVMLVNSAGLTLKVGAKPVVISTNATDLTVDSPITVAGLITGNAPGTVAFTTTKQVAAGSFSGASATLTGAMSSQTLSVSGLSVNSSGLLTGVNAQGFKVGQGQLYGDASWTYLRGGAKTGTYFAVHDTVAKVDGSGIFEVRAQCYVYGGQSVRWHRADGAHTGYMAVSFYGDPGVANAPEGAILIQ